MWMPPSFRCKVSRKDGSSTATMTATATCRCTSSAEIRLRIPMMSISHSDLMPIRSERSDAGLSQCETVIGISQDSCLFSLS